MSTNPNAVVCERCQGTADAQKMLRLSEPNLSTEYSPYAESTRRRWTRHSPSSPSKQFRADAARVYQERLKTSSPLYGEEREQEVQQEIEAQRAQRVKEIYRHVLHKAGDQSARELYQAYFKEDAKRISARRLEAELRVDSPQKDVLITSLQQSPSMRQKRGSIESNAASYLNVFQSSPSPQQRRHRIVNYGRWYLRPKDFDHKLRTDGDHPT
jgi:hypothetical protein